MPTLVETWRGMEFLSASEGSTETILSTCEKTKKGNNI
jgi:hypothetical protein